jgi:hypothetical protein
MPTPAVRATFPNADGEHTVLGKPELKSVKITIPVSYMSAIRHSIDGYPSGDAECTAKCHNLSVSSF